MRSFVGRDILSLKDMERDDYFQIFKAADRLAPHAAERRKNAVELVRGNAVRGKQLRGNRDWLGNDCGGGSGHHGCLHCRTGFNGGQQGLGVESRDGRPGVGVGRRKGVRKSRLRV